MINSLKLKFGFKALFRNPLRIIISVLTAIVAFGVAGMCIFTNTYDILDWGKDIFLNYADPYVNMYYCRGRVDGEFSDLKAPVEEFTYEKTQVVIDRKTEDILCVDAYNGKAHDATIFKETLHIREDILVPADSGYRGIQHSHKNSKFPLRHKEDKAKMSDDDRHKYNNRD